MTTTVSWSRQNPCNDVAFRLLPRTLSSLLVGVRFGAPQCVSGQKDAKDRQAAWDGMADFEKNSISGGDHSRPSQSGIGRAVHVKTTIAKVCHAFLRVDQRLEQPQQVCTSRPV